MRALDVMHAWKYDWLIVVHKLVLLAIEIVTAAYRYDRHLGEAAGGVCMRMY